MELGGTNSLDSLASNGIIDFDAEAFVRGTTPRYVGDPDGPSYLPFEKPLMAEPSFIPPIGTRLSGQPEHDEFGHKKEKSHLNWKKALTGVIVAGVLVLGGIKAKDKIGKLIAKFGKKNAPAAPKQGFFARMKSKITGIFSKKKTNVPPVTTGTGKTSKLSKLFNWSKLPKWAKYTGGGLVGLLGLYGVYSMTSGRSSHSQVMQGVPTQTMALAKQSEEAAANANVAQANEITPTTAIQPQSVVTAANAVDPSQAPPMAAIDTQNLGMTPVEPQQMNMAQAQPAGSIEPQAQQIAQAAPQMAPQEVAMAQPQSQPQPTVSVEPQYQQIPQPQPQQA